MMTYEYARECFAYDPDAGILTWKVRPRDHFNSDRSWKTTNTSRAGTVAGHARKDGYVNLFMGGKSIKAHRLAWLLTYGEWPPGDLDHIDGDPGNNKLANLRSATLSQNACNRSRYRNNTSGYKGVSFVPSICKWRARVQIGGIRRCVGEFGTLTEAANACVAARAELHGEYARAA